MIDDLYLSTNQTKQNVYVVIQEKEVPYEFTDRVIVCVCTSLTKAEQYCKEHPFNNKGRVVKSTYDIEEHEVM